MKLFSKSAILGVMILALVPLVGFSQVVENDAVVFGTPGGFLGDYQLGLSQTTSFNGGDQRGLFAFGITGFNNDQFQFNSFGIAETYSLFPVEQGDVVTPAFVNFVNSATPFASNINFDDPQLAPPAGQLTLEIGESVFFGYWDDRGGPRPIPSNLADEIDNYGWFELGRSDRMDGSFGELEILGGATAIGSGIIAGTTTTVGVPEPSSAIMIGLLGAVGLLRRRR